MDIVVSGSSLNLGHSSIAIAGFLKMAGQG
jgi:hypothetical protein